MVPNGFRMSQQPPPQYSPDGRFWWNGQAWVPVSPVAASIAPRGHGTRNAAISCGGFLAFLIVAGIVASILSSGHPKATPIPVAHATSSAASLSPAGAGSASPVATRDGSCAPQPCANDNYGWIVTVSHVKYGASSGNAYNNPEAGNVFVTMNLSFTNKTGDTQTAGLEFFQLLDGSGVSHDTTLMVNCEYWADVQIAPGGSYGPKCSAFEATAGKPAGIFLIWTPSGFGGSYKIKLG